MINDNNLYFILSLLIILPLLLLSIVLLLGKGGWLIAGYNTKSAEEKKKYDEPAMCRFIGKVMLGVTIVSGGILFSEGRFALLGAAIIVVLSIFAVVYFNTNDRFKV